MIKITKITDRNRLHILKTAGGRPINLVIEAMLEQIVINTQKIKELKRNDSLPFSKRSRKD